VTGRTADLDDLRWHYGEAYLIELIGGRWIAQRRDSHATMSAEGPDQLLGLIRADYAAHPVPRDPRPCRFLRPGRPDGLDQLYPADGGEPARE
jgi:hypothetical protein